MQDTASQTQPVFSKFQKKTEMHQLSGNVMASEKQPHCIKTDGDKHSDLVNY